MTEKLVNAGELFFHEGDEANEAYVIRSGQVDILKRGQQGEVKLATLGDGDVLGELALFEQGMPRSATAKAVSDVTCDVVTRNEFEQLLGQCPPRIMPVIMTVLDRLRSSNKRVTEKEAATILLNVDIERVTVTSANEPPLFNDVEVPVARLPLKIGGFETETGIEKKHQQNNINIACAEAPPIVSSQHCQVEVHEGGIHLRDLGSRFTTTVNGKQIGRGKGAYVVPLQKGENTLQLGGLNSPVVMKVVCS